MINGMFYPCLKTQITYKQICLGLNEYIYIFIFSENYSVNIKPKKRFYISLKKQFFLLNISNLIQCLDYNKK